MHRRRRQNDTDVDDADVDDANGADRSNHRNEETKTSIKTKDVFLCRRRRRCRRRRIYIITLLRGYRVAKRGHHNEHRKQKVLKNCFAVDLNFVRT